MWEVVNGKSKTKEDQIKKTVRKNRLWIATWKENHVIDETQKDLSNVKNKKN